MFRLCSLFDLQLICWSDFQRNSSWERNFHFYWWSYSVLWHVGEWDPRRLCELYWIDNFSLFNLCKTVYNYRSLEEGTHKCWYCIINRDELSTAAWSLHLVTRRPSPILTANGAPDSLTATASGDVYEDMWYRGQRHGHGSIRWLSRDEIYTGQWENGVQILNSSILQYFTRLRSHS